MKINDSENHPQSNPSMVTTLDADNDDDNITLILEWTTSLDTSSRTLFVREGGCRDVHVTSNVELRNNVRLLLNIELRNITSDC